jgi:crotonobetaine/carnitine-CoA ligase
MHALAKMDVPWLLDQWVQRRPDKLCLIWAPFTGERRTWTYRELQLQARAIASGLRQQGVRGGDCVILHLENCPEFIIAWYACAELGAVAVCTNTHSFASDVAYFASSTAAVCAITQARFAERIRESCTDLRFVAVVDDDSVDSHDPDADRKLMRFDKLLGGAASVVQNERDPTRHLSVQFTSGTTSRPKPVLWTHANALWAGKITASHLRLRHEDVTLVFLPLFHVNAQGSMLATHWSGGTVVLQPKFSASRFWAVSLEHRITWCSVIPFMWKAIASQPVPSHHFRFWITGAHLPKVGRRFGVHITGSWGMTETLTQVIFSDADHPGPHGTMGRVAPEYEIEVRDESGETVGLGQAGRLFIRGERGVSLFKEYYRDSEANAKAFDEKGWFDTGDIVRIDDLGWLYFIGREKDMLKVGGENVAAAEIESVIMQTRLVEECAVVGQKHYMLEEVPVAFIIPAAGAPESIKEDILRHCRENLAAFKIVRDIHLVEVLPRSMLEKVAKNELRARLPPIVA